MLPSKTNVDDFNSVRILVNAHFTLFFCDYKMSAIHIYLVFTPQYRAGKSAIDYITDETVRSRLLEAAEVRDNTMLIPC